MSDTTQYDPSTRVNEEVKIYIHIHASRHEERPRILSGPFCSFDGWGNFFLPPILFLRNSKDCAGNVTLFPQLKMQLHKITPTRILTVLLPKPTTLQQTDNGRQLMTKKTPTPTSTAKLLALRQKGTNLTQSEDDRTWTAQT